MSQHAISTEDMSFRKRVSVLDTNMAYVDAGRRTPIEYVAVLCRMCERIEMNEARATQTRGVFGMVCRVKVGVLASPPRIWSLLTDAVSFPRWNSTVTSIEGQIREGQRLRIRVPGSDRTFAPRVSGVVPNQRMTWAGGLAGIFKGVRLFRLAELDDGSTDFEMQERFSGLLFPLIGRLLPDFRPIFERYAIDLKREAERAPKDPRN